MFSLGASASILPSQVTTCSLPALSHASVCVDCNHIIRITRFVYISCFLFFFSFQAWDRSCAEAHCWGSHGEWSCCEEPRKPGRKGSAVQNLQAQAAPQKRRVCTMRFSLKPFQCLFKMSISCCHCLVFLVLLGSRCATCVASATQIVLHFKCFVLLCFVCWLLLVHVLLVSCEWPELRPRDCFSPMYTMLFC